MISPAPTPASPAPSNPTAPHRPDGRTSHASLRPLSSTLSPLSHASGSCHYFSGSTSVLAALHGPAPPKLSSAERVKECTIGIVLKGYAAECGGMTDREVEVWLHDSLIGCVKKEAYPRSGIVLTLSVLQNDGSVLSALLSAAVLSLLDAGIELRSLPVPLTICVTSDALAFDPCRAEEETSDGSLVVLVMDSVEEGIRSSLVVNGAKGGLRLGEYLACVEGAERAKAAILAFWRIALEQKTTREHKTLWTL